ncbi:MAG: 50S ribosomal protein L11 methyltransferase [Saprospiraceae bacterium]
MNYFKYEITCAEDLSEILIAFLAEYPFDSFMEFEKGFNAYLPERDYDPSLDQHLNQLQSDFPFTFQSFFIEGKNWNQEWEKHFDPIIVDDFCGIRAEFHPSLENVKHELVINPKMAFGTGHHETTRMMIRQMRSLDLEGKSVLDYGAGTGILAILAIHLGAAHCEGLEIETMACENAVENCSINGVGEQVKMICGKLDNSEGNSFDIILANINRNVILESLPTLFSKLNPGGVMLTSGYIQEDIQKMEAAFLNHKFSLENRMEEGNWICHRVHKNQ